MNGDRLSIRIGVGVGKKIGTGRGLGIIEE